MSQFLSLANDHDLRLHEDIQTRSCAACGTIFVPGVNSKVRVVPVAETRAEREKRKRVERKKAKQDKKKQLQDQKALEAGGGSDLGGATTSSSESKEKPTTTTTTTTTSQPESGTGSDTSKCTIIKSPQAPLRSKKIIRITPHTELAQQQQQQQNQQRINIRNGSAASNAQKPDKHANQILNHIIYSCQRCDRVTELPGTKAGFLSTRIKVTKPVSQRRKLKALQKQQQEQEPTATVGPTSSASTKPSTPTTTMSGLQPLNAITSARSSPKPSPSTPTNNNNNTTITNTNTKRLASSRSSPSPAAAGHQDPKRTKYSVSLPASPTTGLSRATSAAPSAATSPASSPRPFGSDDKKPGLGGGGNNKKKKKGGLINLLANQKSKDSDAGAGGSAGGSGGGDSVLANFLMGL
jgi:hypothetical protein